MDIFIGMFFFGNMYIWRRFNIFLGFKLILALVVSVGVDLFWEVTKIALLSVKYHKQMKKIRIQGLILNGLNIIIKCFLIFLYFKLSGANQKETILGLDNELSVIEVDEHEYLT